MLTLNFKPFPLLTTQRLTLRRITASDVPEILFLRSDEQMMRYIDRPPMKSTDEVLQWMGMINENIDTDQSIAWGIQLKNPPKLIGIIMFWHIKKEHYRAEIGYMLHTAYQGNGFMHEALSCVLDYGFSAMKLHSVEANVNPANEASINLLERSHFVREAYHKENYYYNGQFLDSAIYSLVTPFKDR
jgi:ribosomal-protein-alanine N-acetyltransferase